MKILITGMAGFIGFHTAKNAIQKGHTVIGIDNLNDYYAPALKVARLKELGLEPESSNSNIYPNLSFEKMDLADDAKITELFEKEAFDAVFNLAAQAGVRYSITNPRSYIKSNAEGFLNILEGCRHTKVKHLIYASSSSVYGENSNVPFSTTDPVDHPISLYAATKRSNELMAHTYSHLYNLPTTGLRFFTVYGPWGRPDMAPFLFAKAILNQEPIKVFNNGDMERDFTYVDDIVEAQMRLLEKPPQGEDSRNTPNNSTAPYKIYNIGNSSPIKLLDFIQEMELAAKGTTEKVYMPAQPGDVTRTYADVEDLFSLINFRPQTSLKDGLKNFIDWYQSYYS